jgi:hypothetical protein
MFYVKRKMFYTTSVSNQRSGKHLRPNGIKEVRNGLQYVMKNVMVCRLWVTCYRAGWYSGNGLDLYSTV